MKWTISKEQLAKTLATTEEALNLVGYIPMVSVLSATIRSLGAKCQMIAGFSSAIFFFFCGFYRKNSKFKHFQRCRLSIEQALHGVFNFCRSLIEFVPFLSLVTCLPYDKFLRKRFRYVHERDLDREDPEIIDIK